MTLIFLDFVPYLWTDLLSMDFGNNGRNMLIPFHLFFFNM
jgi:hypothetical protein